MLWDEADARQYLNRIVGSMTYDSAWREDLFQEGLIHLWLIEVRRPGQTRSWYHQSCRFHLQHYVASGRSVDSAKRVSGRSGLIEDLEEEQQLEDTSDSGDLMFSHVSASDIITLLSARLQPDARAVLLGLADGLGVREIGRNLNLSHAMVIKHRRKIANLFQQLEKPNHNHKQKTANGDCHPAPMEWDRSARLREGIKAAA